MGYGEFLIRSGEFWASTSAATLGLACAQIISFRSRQSRSTRVTVFFLWLAISVASAAAVFFSRPLPAATSVTWMILGAIALVFFVSANFKLLVGLPLVIVFVVTTGFALLMYEDWIPLRREPFVIARIDALSSRNGSVALQIDALDESDARIVTIRGGRLVYVVETVGFDPFLFFLGGTSVVRSRSIYGTDSAIPADGSADADSEGIPIGTRRFDPVVRDFVFRHLERFGAVTRTVTQSEATRVGPLRVYNVAVSSDATPSIVDVSTR